MFEVYMSLEKSTWSHFNSQGVYLISLVLHGRLLVANDIKIVCISNYVCVISKIYSIAIASIVCIYVSYQKCMHTVLVIEQ